MQHSHHEDFDLLLSVAVMYYEQNKSQQAIARKLGVSRSTVSRYLGQARELGVVQIDIVPPNRDPALSERLRERLGLRSVHIAPGRAQESDPGPILAQPLIPALDEARLASGDIVLVSWGRAVASVSRHVRRSYPGVIVAPAMGGYAGDEPWFQPNEIARDLARGLGAQQMLLNAPAIVSPALAATLQGEAQTSSVIKLWDRAKLALVGVGAWPKPDPNRVAAGFPLDDQTFAEAVGDVAGRAFTADGEPVPWPPERHLLGLTPEQLRRIPHVIGLAGAPAKALAAVAAARAGLINALVTDAPTARAIDIASRPTG